MNAIDRLPKAWRALVHEYGATIVLAMWDETSDSDHASDALVEWRRRRQDEWLRTNYLTARLRREFQKTVNHAP